MSGMLGSQWTRRCERSALDVREPASEDLVDEEDRMDAVSVASRLASRDTFRSTNGFFARRGFGAV